ncbi:MAG: response regulator [Candidatus Sericytochromatia bacterium]|nr:response regulator [Candidatus Sericytochromatia bacterium]
MINARPERTRVLVIDDDAAIRDLLARELPLRGFEIRTAGDRSEAVRLCQRFGFDVVISDSEGPDMSGAAVMPALRGQDTDLALIVATERASVDDALASLKQGAMDYVQKPYDLDSLARRLAEVQARRRSQHLAGLNATGMTLLQASGREDIAQVAVHHGQAVLGAEAAALMVGDPFSPDAVIHMSDDLGEMNHDLVAQLAQQTYQGGVPDRLLAGLSYGEGMSPAMAATSYRSAACYPLRVQDQYLGTLILLRTEEVSDFSHDELKQGVMYAVALSLALEITRVAGKFQAQTVTDELTGLYSRRFLFETLWQMVKRLTRSNPPVLSCLMIGIDGAAGLEARLERSEFERLIKRTARLLGRTLRASDIVARYTPTSFGVLLPHTNEAGGRLVVDKIRAAIAAELADTLPINVGIGLASYDFVDKEYVRSMKNASDLSLQLLHWAELALQQAQTGGPGGLAVFQE